SPTGRGDRPRSRLATKAPFPDRGAKRLIRATTAYAAFRSPGERSDAGNRSLYKCTTPPFSQSH
ncbi:hypothetical protein CWN03_01980, partial [Klebsiella quasipneumoniae]